MSFWKEKHVLVTGGAGFLGSYLVGALLDHGAKVDVLDDFSRGTNRHPDAVYLEGDAGDLKSCRIVLENPHLYFAVFNLAASVAGVLYNQSHHLEMFERNIRLQTTPVIAAKETDVAHFLQVSSVCVYAPQYASGAIEDDGQLGEPVGANAGYSWSKRLGERASKWASLPHCVIVRPSNMYGPRDYFDERAHVVPNLIKKCLDENPVISMKSPPNTRRELLFVRDCAEGILLAAERGKTGESYNLGTHGRTCVSLRELIGEIQSVCETDKPVEWKGGWDGGDPVRWSNCDRATQELGFHPETILTDGLQQTVKWYLGEKVIV